MGYETELLLKELMAGPPWSLRSFVEVERLLRSGGRVPARLGQQWMRLLQINCLTGLWRCTLGARVVFIYSEVPLETALSIFLFKILFFFNVGNFQHSWQVSRNSPPVLLVPFLWILVGFGVLFCSFQCSCQHSARTTISTGFGTSCDTGYHVTIFFLKKIIIMQALQGCF